MRQTPVEEPLLPPWVMRAVVILAPLAGLILIWYLLTSVLNVPVKIWLPMVAALGIAVLIYFGGRYYKPFHVNRQGRCVARGPAQRKQCRHFVLGARLGGGCGRLREDGKCRYVR